MKKYFVTIASLAVAGVLGWLVWRGDAVVHPMSATKSAVMSASGPSVSTLERSSPARTDEPSSKESADAAVLAKAKQLLDRLTVLKQVDSIENLQAAAELEIEFNAMLDERTASLLVQQMPGDFVNTWFGDLSLRHWARANRPDAAAWMARHPSASPVAATALAHNWVIEDAPGLKAYVNGLPEGPWKHNVSKTAGEEALVADKPALAIEFLDTIAGEDVRRDEIYEWTVTKWAMTDPVAAINWAVKTGPSQMQERLISAVAVGCAHLQPERALQLASTDPVWDRARGSIVRIWAAKDPVRAAQRVENSPKGPARDQMLESLLAIWGVNQPKRAAEWQASLADPLLREEAALVLAKVRSEAALLEAH